jgi:hypothetical protein
MSASAREKLLEHDSILQGFHPGGVQKRQLLQILKSLELAVLSTITNKLRGILFRNFQSRFKV